MAILRRAADLLRCAAGNLGVLGEQNDHCPATRTLGGTMSSQTADQDDNVQDDNDQDDNESRYQAAVSRIPWLMSWENS